MCVKSKNKINILDVDKEALIKQQVFAINKPLEWTSNDVVSYLKRYFNFKKIGHGGTLDPLADGVLIIGVEQGTKKLNTYMNHHKEYIFEMQLGIRTPSYDLSTQIIEKKDYNHNISRRTVKQVIKNYFMGEYLQTPPMYSAKKVNGVRAYKLAFQNKQVELKKCDVKIYKFKVIDVNNERGTIKLKVDVSKGFYIRSFANDLALKLDTYATVIKLTRTKVDKFNLSNSYQLIKKEA